VAILPTRSVQSRGRSPSGVNYFDTAVQYGDGESEKNLGRVLQSLRPVAVGTKVRLQPNEFVRIADAVTMSLEGSLARLHLDRPSTGKRQRPLSRSGSPASDLGGQSANARRSTTMVGRNATTKLAR
jgi:aldo/keto reductase family protein